MFLGLDVSTATIGIAIFNEDGSLYRISHLGLEIKKNKLENPDEAIYLKKKMFENFIKSDIIDFYIKK
jgi:RNase H-fold protein (predicted Holliday junction resolvase)